MGEGAASPRVRPHSCCQRVPAQPPVPVPVLVPKTLACEEAPNVSFRRGPIRMQNRVYGPEMIQALDFIVFNRRETVSHGETRAEVMRENSHPRKPCSSWTMCTSR